MSIVTSDLSEFGYRELEELGDILHAMSNGNLPANFGRSGIVPMFNKNSGNVFLTNDDYQVAMMNGDDLEEFHTCGYCGHEGFADEFEHEPEDEECEEQMKHVKELSDE